MSRRKENVRKACDWIDATIDTAVKNTDNLSSLERVRMMNALLNSIKTYTHRIKRTTWRGDENKSKWDKDWDKYINPKNNYGNNFKDAAKKLNTNQTTTANIDVSTIPYY